jgi:hypothetical protein
MLMEWFLLKSAVPRATECADDAGKEVGQA